MSKKTQTRKRLSKALVSLFVLLVVFAPALLTAKWVMGLVGNTDPRKVTTVAPLQVRPINNTKAPLQPFSEPIVSVTFDDGWESVYTNGLPILQKDGIQTTQYIISGTMANNYSYMSEPQIKSMEDAGHEIAAHTVTHADLTTLDDQQLTYQLAYSKQVLAKDFGPIYDFTSPYGAYNQHTLDVISKYYRSQKNAEGDPTSNDLESINVKKTFSPMNITSYTVRKTTTSAELKKLLQDARENNGWLVLTYHQVQDSSSNSSDDSEYAVTPAVFAKQMAIIDDSNMRSATVGQVLDVLMPNSRESN